MRGKNKGVDENTRRLRLALCECGLCDPSGKYAFALLPERVGYSHFMRHGVIVDSKDLVGKHMTEKQRGALYANEVSTECLINDNKHEEKE
jgi:hypothetical protein